MQRTSEDRHPNIIKLRFYYHELVPDPTTGVESLYLNMVLEFYVSLLAPRIATLSLIRYDSRRRSFERRETT